MVEGNGKAIYDRGEADTIIRIIRKLLVENYNFNQIESLLDLCIEEQEKYFKLLNLEQIKSQFKRTD